MFLRDVFCQEHAIGILQRAYAAGRVPHAYIFAGPEGVGKFTTAQAWARLLLCAEPQNKNGFADSCGGCESCRLFEGAHPDFEHVYKELLEFTKDGKNKAAPVEFPIDVVREFVIDKVSSKPTVSQRRVFVLSETEKLNISSQNALLKVLEEPPDYCHIILLCTRLDRLLATTKSRAHTVRFGPVDEGRIVESLEGLGMGKKQAVYLARLSQGSLGTAIQWGELEAAGAGLCETGSEIAASLAKAEYGDSVELAERFLGYAKKLGTAWGKMDNATSKTDLNRRALKTVVEMMISVLHDAMAMEVGARAEIVNSERRKDVEALSRRLGAEGAAERIGECYRTEQWIEASVNEKLNFEQLLLSLFDSGRMQV